MGSFASEVLTLMMDRNLPVINIINAIMLKEIEVKFQIVCNN